MKGVDGLVIRAFEQGVSAARSDKARSSNPYRPLAEQEQWESWNCGFDEAEPRYRISPREHVALKKALLSSAKSRPIK
jgi:hypothetical protein